MGVRLPRSVPLLVHQSAAQPGPLQAHPEQMLLCDPSRRAAWRQRHGVMCGSQLHPTHLSTGTGNSHVPRTTKLWGGFVKSKICIKNEHQRVPDPTGRTATWSPQSLLEGSTQPWTLMCRGLSQLLLYKPIPSLHTSLLTGAASHKCHCLPMHLCTRSFFISFIRLEATGGQAPPLCDLPR